MFSPQDIQFEEEVSRNPYNVKVWWNYIHYKKEMNHSNKSFSKNEKTQNDIYRFMIYERALHYLPRSYKLWCSYLSDRQTTLKNKSITNKKYGILVDTFERSLIYMNKMPKIWLKYCELLIYLKKGTATRLVFDRALQALPLTQHKDIWDLYIDWVISFDVMDTAIRVYRRFLMYAPSYRETFCEYLENHSQFEEAARQLAICLNDSNYVSPSGKSIHHLWMHLCELCALHPSEVMNSLPVDAIIRSGIQKFSDEVGRLWTSLADYYIRLGQFEKARDVYEEALNSVSTVRDFTIIFDAYVKIEESLLTTKIRFMQDISSAAVSEEEEDKEQEEEIQMDLSRLEYLMEKRPFLLNSVVLRQNPHNVHEWFKRIKLYKNDTQKCKMTYLEAIDAINPKLCTGGRLSGLWLGFAQFYEKLNDHNNSTNVFERAIQVNYKTVDELANVWCGWAEMEMRLEKYDNALHIMKQSVLEPVMTVKRRKALAAAHGKGNDTDLLSEGEQSLVSDKLYKNIKVWSLYLDLEESLGTVESCRSAYDRAMDLKLITIQMVLNYANYLEEHNYFEDSFRVYERAVVLFQFPQVKNVWKTYLDKFITRYEGTKLERLRDIFERSVQNCPSEDAIEFYLRYAKAEEQYGLARHAMAIYDRATKAVPAQSRLDMFRLYAKKVEQYYGITKTRAIFEKGLQELDDDSCKQLSLEFADMERKLGEIDRCRAVFQYGSQFADPRRDSVYWERWRDFEELHGNEGTFRDMLRVQRSVETSYSQVNYLASEMLAGEQQAPMNTITSLIPDEMSDLDAMAIRAEYEALTRTQERMNASLAVVSPIALSTGNLASEVGQKRKKDDNEIDEDKGGSFQRKVAKNTDEIDI